MVNAVELRCIAVPPFGSNRIAFQYASFRVFVVNEITPGCGGSPRRAGMLVMNRGWSEII